MAPSRSSSPTSKAPRSSCRGPLKTARSGDFDAKINAYVEHQVERALAEPQAATKSVAAGLAVLGMMLAFVIVVVLVLKVLFF